MRLACYRLGLEVKGSALYTNNNHSIWLAQRELRSFDFHFILVNHRMVVHYLTALHRRHHRHKETLQMLRKSDPKPVSARDLLH